MALFITTFFAVFLLAFQQQNVVHRHYKSAALTALLIAAAQFGMFKGVIAADWHGFIAMGLGGALGVTASMYVHRKLLRGDKKNVSKPKGKTSWPWGSNW